MGARDWFRTTISLVGLCLSASAYGAQVSREPLRTLVTAHEVHSLTHEEAAGAYPVHLHAVVTYFDPYEDARLSALFVHDSTGCIFVFLPPQPVLHLKPGDLVDVTGVSGTGDFAPVVARPHVRVIGKSHVPAQGPKVSFEQLRSGGLDGQWVEFEGLVHAAHVTATNAIFDITTAGGSLSAATVREEGVNYDALVDSRVRVSGNVAPVFNWKMQMVGVHLFFPSVHQLQVLQPAPPDPFKQPVLPVSNLMNFKAGQQLEHRVHVQGTVTLQWPGLMLCIQQGAQTLCMKSSQADRVKPGDVVDAAGFPAILDFRHTLEDATFRLTSPGIASPPAVQVTAEEALSGKREGELVSLEGVIVGQAQARGGLELMLRSGSILVSALLPKELAGRGPSPWKEGSILRVSGICLGEAGLDIWALREGQIQPSAVQILLRSTDDVQLLQAPSWWTPEHILISFAAVGVLFLVSFTWIVILRHTVKQRTRALCLSEERLRDLSEHDPLTGLPNRLLLNDRLRVALARAERSESRLGLLMVDLDGFKAVNDEMGHEAGDKLLCEMAARLTECVRITDTVARIGGDEFVVLLPDIRTPAEAENIARKIVAGTTTPFVINQAFRVITLSLGVVTFPEGGTDLQMLMRSADEMMYAAKNMGKNGCQIYRPAYWAHQAKNGQVLRNPPSPLPSSST